jgi:hypothetical protein
VDNSAPFVRKFFHPSAFFNGASRKGLLSNLFQNSPYYEPDPLEVAALQPLLSMSRSASCICRWPTTRTCSPCWWSEVTARAAARAAPEEIVPLRTWRPGAGTAPLPLGPSSRSDDEAAAQVAALEFQEKIRRLNAETER